MSINYESKKFLRERELEARKCFEKSREELNILYFRLISLLLSVLSAIYIVNALLEGLYKSFLFIAAILINLLNLIIFVGARRRLILRNISLLICTYIFIFQQIAIESGTSSVNGSSQSGDKKGIYFKGMLSTLLSGINFLSPSPWWMVSIQNLANLIVLLSRILNEGTAEISYPEILFTLTLFHLLNTYLKYRSDKNEFNTFKSRLEKERKLGIYKILMEDLLLNPVLVIREDSLDVLPEIILANKCALNWFEAPDVTQIPQILIESTATEAQNLSNNMVQLNNKSEPESLLKLIRHKFSMLLEGDFVSLHTNIDLYRLPLKCSENFSLLQGAESSNRDQEMYVEMKIGRFVWDSSPSLVILLNDLTSVKRVLDLQNLHNNKDKLLATVSHELRNPLNGIIGIVDMVHQEVESKSVRKKLSVVMDAGNSLLNLINDIMDNSQICSGSLRLNFKTLPISFVVEKVVSLMKFQFKKKGVELITKFKCSEETLIYVDPQRLQQVLINLLANSLKFTDLGSITLSAKLKEISGNHPLSLSDLDERPSNPTNLKRKSHVIFSVRDTGCGIREENLNKLFTFFATFDDNHSNPQGVGLGLAVSQKLAESFLPLKAGGIQVRSRSGEGSKFWFPVLTAEGVCHQETDEKIKVEKPYLSSKILNENCDSNQNNNIKITKKQLRSFRVLLVDDDQVNHFVIENFLGSFEGFVYEGANNGLEALNRIWTLKERDVFYDLIILDSRMPVMDGLETAREIRRLIEKELIPSVKLATFTAEDSSKAFPQGTENFFTIKKPITIGELKNTLESIFNIRIRLRSQAGKVTDY